MQPKNRLSINLFIGGFLLVVSFFLISLPVLASPIISSLSQGNSPDSAITNSGLTKNEAPSSTPTPTIQLSQSSSITETQTQPEITTTPSLTPTPTLSPTATTISLPTQNSYLPNLYREFFNPTDTPTPTPPPPESVLFCDSLSVPIYIPDNNNSGINNDISISDGRVLVGLRLYLDISHTYVGDLVVTLSNLNTNQTVTAINRPGAPPYGCSNNDIVTILGDSAIEPADDQCASYPRAISGIYLPSESFQMFSGEIVAGTWRLNVSDHYTNDTGALNHWCLETKLSDTMPPPTPPPTPVILPPEATVYGMSGQDQQYTLDCESRSAVDWARHFNVSIDEIDFLNHLPKSDDPEAGFVGNPNGSWGNTPPNDYGVHALPVASLLQDYGLSATSVKSLSWDELRAEIASGRPVMVWIIGDSFRNIVNGIPRYYIAGSTGNLSVVAPYEHTVIVTGYNSSDVTVLNGSRFMTVPISQFLDSWSVLDFMAVVGRP